METEPASLESKGDTAPMGWRVPLLALLAYTVAVAAATWPFVLTFATELPSTGDPLQHLWIMRWYKQCLLEGRSPLVCPDLHYPVGAPIGNFSPLHLQSIVYFITSSFVSNDVLSYNVVWLAGFLMTGMGTFALARYVLRDNAAAFLAGLLTMLSGPVLYHSHSHTELIYVGGFPLFLLAWMRFIDRPNLGRMALAVLGFVLVAMCAAYYMVFAVFPAALYLVWKAVEHRRDGGWRWLGRRLVWASGFSAACLPLVLLLFAGQVWNLWHGQPGTRPRWAFDMYGVPWWAYVVPLGNQMLSKVLPFDPYALPNTPGEPVAYLGIITLLLVHRTWLRRVRFRDSGFWWAATAMLVVLSLGSYLPYGGDRIEMPAGWLRDCDWFLPFRLIRVPGRFKLFVPVCTGIIAGASWLYLRSRLPRPRWRGLAFVSIAALAVVDLAHVPYGSEPIPEVPRGYAWLLDRDPEATWVDAPQMSSSSAMALNAYCTYWQAEHGGRTTAGYSGHQNHPFDNLLTWNSPFADYRLREASFPAAGTIEHYDLVRQADFLDYAWLYLNRHDLRYVVLHRWAAPALGFHLDRLADRLEPAKIYDDEALAIYDRDLLDRPRSPVPLCSEGWAGFHLLPRDRFVRLMEQTAIVDLFNPRSDEPLLFAIRARSIGPAKLVRLVAENGDELARWRIEPGEQRLYLSPPFRLPEGLGKLRLECDGEVSAHRVSRLFDGETRPASLIVSGICLRSATAEEQSKRPVLAVSDDEATIRQ